MGAGHLLLVNEGGEGGEELLIGGRSILLLPLDCGHGGGEGEGYHLRFSLLLLSSSSPASHLFSSSSSFSASPSGVRPPTAAWQGARAA